MTVTKLALLLFISIAVTGCKITVTVPEGGAVISRSGNHDCESGSVCVVEPPLGAGFSDTFTAIPEEGYVFSGWTKSDGYLCGGSDSACILEGVPNSLTDMAIDTFLQPVFLRSEGELTWDEGVWDLTDWQ